MTAQDARDEAFWREQEARREKKLGQPCCTQSGMSWSMIDMPGDFAVVIHGEFDCVNCFHHHVGRSAASYYSTRLTEEQITNGQTHEPLRTLLRLIAEETSAEAVIVLGTCPVEVIGDRFETVVEAIAEETGLPMIPLHTSGLAMMPQTRMLDWLYTTLSSLPPIEPTQDRWAHDTALVALDTLLSRVRREPTPRPPIPKERRLNLVGLPEARGVPEPARVLGSLGLEVNGIYPFAASLRDWRAIGHAAAAFMVDASMFPRLRSRLERLGQAVVDLPLPVGLAPTLAFYERIASHFGVPAELDAHATTSRTALERFRAEVGSRRMAVAVRMLNTYRYDQLAFEGLGDVPALVEMGFDLTLLVQGPPEADARAAFQAKLDERGFEGLPFEIFPGPYALADTLRRGRYEVCYAADSSREAARDAGVPMIAARGLAPFLEGVAGNLEQMRRMLTEAGAR